MTQTETQHPGRAPKRRRVLWTPEKIQILRDHWPLGGMTACAPLLPDHTPATIKVIANRHGIRRIFKKR